MNQINVYLHEIPGTNDVMFHVRGTGESIRLSSEEALRRGVCEYCKGSLISGPTSLVRAIGRKAEEKGSA